MPEGSLTADPVPLPKVKGQPRQVCIADLTGAVRLVTGTAGGNLKLGHRWQTGGQVTAGPYVEVLPNKATRIACVIDKRRLIWIDPDKERFSGRTQESPARELMGQPQLVAGMVVVADESGLIVGLDPDKGTVLGKPLQLPGSTVPAASPVGFGDDRLFTPLSDGTVLLPPLKPD